MNQPAERRAELTERLYATMATIRAFETSAERLQASGALESGLHLSIGQEAVATGVCEPLRRVDLITTTHRGHGHCIAKGGELAPMMAELFAKQGGYCGGKSGSMHIADPASGILGANAIVGAGIPIALGAALAFQQRGEDSVAVAFFGDGAVAEGVFHESLNIASLWHLPIVFVCEDNGYAEMTPASVHLATGDIATFGAGYDLPAESVDGNDVFAVRTAAVTAIDRARSGAGPTLLHARTYRWRGHYQGDPEVYRSADEVAAWQQKDPLRVLRAHRPDAGEVFDQLERAAESAVAQAVETVRDWPDVAHEAVSEHVYAEAG